MLELLLNEAIYENFIRDVIPQSKKFLWIGTADVKDMHVQRGRNFAPFLHVLSDLVERGVEVRMLHAKEPGPRFRQDFDRFPALVRSERFERLLCPRVHFKVVIVDGRQAYLGSANLTGAGMGAKHRDKRNFEAGLRTDDPQMIRSLMQEFDRIFLGDACQSCRLRDFCPDPIA